MTVANRYQEYLEERGSITPQDDADSTTPLREDGEDRNTSTPSLEAQREDGEDKYTSGPSLDAVEVLEEMRAFHKRFVYHSQESIHDVIILWTLHTYALDKFIRTPRLYVHSPEPGCGKTTQADLLEFMSKDAQNTTGVTSAVLFRLIDRDKPTLIVDEADTVFTSRRAGVEDIKAILNAGYAYDKTVFRCNPTSYEPEEFSAYAAVALIGIDNTAMPDTIVSRSIPIKMTRARGTNLEVWDAYDHEEYREHLANVLPLIAESIPSRDKPVLPSHLSNRDAEIWRPLFTVANAIGGLWPERVLEASRALHWENNVSESTKVLTVTRDYFKDHDGLTKVTTTVLTEYVNKSGAAEHLTPKGLNAILAPYGIKPVKSNGLSTYRMQDLARAWDEWLEEESLTDNLPNLPEDEPDTTCTPILPNLPEDDEW